MPDPSSLEAAIQAVVDARLAPLRQQITDLLAQQGGSDSVRWLTINGTAERVGCGRERVEKAIAHGQLIAAESPGARGRAPRYRIRSTDADAWSQRGAPTMKGRA